MVDVFNVCSIENQEYLVQFHNARIYKPVLWELSWLWKRVPYAYPLWIQCIELLHYIIPYSVRVSSTWMAFIFINLPIRYVVHWVYFFNNILGYLQVLTAFHVSCAYSRTKLPHSIGAADSLKMDKRKSYAVTFLVIVAWVRSVSAHNYHIFTSMVPNVN